LPYHDFGAIHAYPYRHGEKISDQHQGIPHLSYRDPLWIVQKTVLAGNGCLIALTIEQKIAHTNNVCKLRDMLVYLRRSQDLVFHLVTRNANHTPISRNCTTNFDAFQGAFNSSFIT
jgi:hypothetical protein